jgi:hypothetical protein
MSDENGRLKVVDGMTLSAEHRALLRPGEAVTDRHGRTHFLPRFFYEIQSWKQANALQLTPKFTFAELMTVDCREADLLLNTFPHYVPCAVTILARYLEALREKVDAPVFIAANGGYRSPTHQFSREPGPHNWATAANIFRIGDTFLDDEKSIEKYGRIAEAIAPEVFVRPFGHGPDETDDHLHLDIGYVTHVPRDWDEARPA